MTVSFWTRLTLPFALVVVFLMFISSPFNFIFTGSWGYDLSKNSIKVFNWFKSLRLV